MLNVLLGVIAFVFIGVSLITSLLSTRKFSSGPIRKYLFYINMSFLFIVLPLFLWTLYGVILGSFTDENISLSISVLTIFASLFFTKSSLDLRWISEVYGFKHKRGKR